MNLQDINNLDFRDVGSWPWQPKAVVAALVFAVVLFLGYWFLWSDQLASLDKARAKEQDLRAAFLAKDREAVNLAAYRKQYADVQRSFGALLHQLPNKSEMAALLIEINQAGIGRGLKFDLFKPAAQETRNKVYAELPIQIRVDGSYNDLGAFATDVAKLPRIVTLDDINVTPTAAGTLTMNAVAKTYRYLSEQELAAAHEKGKKGGH
ncbi:MAG: type 4a pilus biogenesis protein PilO [Betaproteobacteria bacterium]|nr:type 4a pilus biogenesis protein PilO [Betaproteobacteria bacterium]